MRIPALTASVLLAELTGTAKPPAHVKTGTEALSDGIVYPDTHIAPAFLPLSGDAAINAYIPSSKPYVAHIEPRYVSGFVAPSGYTYSWVVDGYRLAIDTVGNKNYLTRTTISKDASSTTQAHVNACTQFCEKTPTCAMASVIRFNNFSEGNVVCAVYSATAPKSDAIYTTGPFNGPGQVSASYTFNRKAGRVPGTFTSTVTSSAVTTSSTRSVTTSSGFTTIRTSSSTTSTVASSSTTSPVATTSSTTSTPTSASSTSTTSSSTSSSTGTSTTSSAGAAATATTNTTTAPVYDQWVWVDVPGTQCADGSATGFALNLHAGATELVISYQQGGSCYDYNSCYVQKTAYNIDSGFSNATFWAQNQPNTIKWWFPFARDNQWNPWQKANYAWIPYCTGDWHAGDNTVLYPGAASATNHKGWSNAKLDMAKIKQMVPAPSRVLLAGSSAGAFGAILQYQNAQNIFSGTRVDLLADSGETPKSALARPSQNIQPPRCPTCDDASFDSYIVGLAKANTGSRFASMSWSNDTTIPVNQGVSYDDFSAEVVRLFKQQNAETSNSRNFMVQGSGHMLLWTTQYNAADGYTQATFLNKFKTDDPGWSSH
ncbi:hypothetical protein PaG_05519 [Moesziomyces aphidis]|uniref:Uncharacterized protein n=1 Tax=Moesziomyces aphidis TaxID=84754 RepID=W3VFJ9_MOEAP|nr:hypothetical protein PaG_05519 [Moesziomyces aphidis]